MSHPSAPPNTSSEDPCLTLTLSFMMCTISYAIYFVIEETQSKINANWKADAALRYNIQHVRVAFIINLIIRRTILLIISVQCSLSDQTNRICLLRWRELAFQKKVPLLYFQNALLRRCGIKIQIWNRSRIRINYRSQRYDTGSQEGTYMAANYSVWKSIWHKMWVDMKWQYPPYSHFFTCMITYSHIISVVPSSTLAALKRIRSTQKDTTECSSKKTTNVRC